MIIHKLGAYADIDLTLTKINAVFSRKYINEPVLENKHRLDSAMVLVLNGQAVYHYLDTKQEMAVQKHNIFFLNQGSKYYRIADDKDPFEFILISYTACDKGTSLPFGQVNQVADPDYYRTAFQDMLDTWTKKWLGYRLRCNAMMQELCYRLVHDVVGQSLNDRAVAKLHPAIDYMERNYRAAVNIEELAEQVNLSVSYFHRLFRATYGVSPIQYLISIRIDMAKDLIRSGLHSISEVADQVGYDDIYYFSRLFKKATGKSPTEYYKKCRDRVSRTS